MKKIILSLALFSSLAQASKLDDKLIGTLLKDVTDQFSEIYKASNATSAPTDCQIQNGEKPKIKNEKITISDCDTNVSVTDYKIIEMVENDIIALNKKFTDRDSKEYQTEYNKLVDGVDKSLSTAAKGLLATNLVKHMFDESKMTKDLTMSMIEYRGWSDVHIKSFGPGSTYASMGFFDSTLGNSHELYNESGERVAKSYVKVIKLINQLDIPKEEKKAMKMKIKEFNDLMYARDGKMINATRERLDAFQSSIYQITAAIEAKLVNALIPKQALKKNKYIKALTDGLNAGSSQIFKDQTILIIKALNTGADFGCSWGVMASKENPKIWRAALKTTLMKSANGTITAALGFGVSDSLSEETKVVLEAYYAYGAGKKFLKGAFGWGENAVEAGTKFVNAGEKIEQAQKTTDLIERGRLELEARELIRESNMLTIDAGADLLALGSSAISLSKNLGDLKVNYDKLFSQMLR